MGHPHLDLYKYFVFRMRQLQRRSKATEKQAISAATLEEAIQIARNCEVMSLQIKAKDPDAAMMQQLLIRSK